MIEQVYNQYYNTAGNYHWVGVHSGDHILQKGEEMSKSIDIGSVNNQFHVRTVQLVELTDECIEKIVNKITEASERKRGEWIGIEDYEGLNVIGYYCSVCDLPMETEVQTNYCPNCGADMKGEK